jgi:hypothetical protein
MPRASPFSIPRKSFAYSWHIIISEMVSLVPRSSSFAVSGTPAKSQVSDLINVLKYELALPMFQPPADRFSQIPSGG